MGAGVPAMASAQKTGVAHAYTVTINGEVDASSAPLLATRLAELRSNGAALIIVNASHVEFMDSTGLRALIVADKAMRSIGGRLLIEGMSGAVQRVLEITGLLERYGRPPE